METIHNSNWTPGEATHATWKARMIHGEPRVVLIFYPCRGQNRDERERMALEPAPPLSTMPDR